MLNRGGSVVRGGRRRYATRVNGRREAVVARGRVGRFVAVCAAAVLSRDPTGERAGARRILIGRLSVLTVVVAACCGCAGTPPGTGMPAVELRAGTPPVLVSHYRLLDAGPPAAIAADSGGVWLALRPPPASLTSNPGEGQVQRVDPDSGAVSAGWPVGGAPVAMAAGQSVWVATGRATGPIPAAGGDQVLQFAKSGQLLASYPVPNPAGVVAYGDAAVVAYQLPSGAYLRRLSGGTADPGVRLAAAGRSLGTSVVWCPDNRVWAASFDDRAQHLHLQQFSAVPGQPLQDLHLDTVLTASGTTTLACQTSGLAALVAGLDHDTLFLIPHDTPASPPREAMVAPSSALAGDGMQGLWLIHGEIYPSPKVEVQLLNGADLTTAPSVALSGAADLYTGMGPGLWIIGRDPQDQQSVVLSRIARP